VNFTISTTSTYISIPFVAKSKASIGEILLQKRVHGKGELQRPNRI
jgi:hypothetical protein